MIHGPFTANHGVHKMSKHNDFQHNLLKESSVAARLNIEVATLRRWRWAGKGPKFLKIGSAVRYDRDSLTEFLEAAERNSTSDLGPEGNRHDR